jgi:hypothetical protein
VSQPQPPDDVTDGPLSDVLRVAVAAVVRLHKESRLKQVAENMRARIRIERPEPCTLGDGNLKSRRFLEFFADPLAELQDGRR